MVRNTSAAVENCSPEHIVSPFWHNAVGVERVQVTFFFPAN